MGTFELKDSILTGAKERDPDHSHDQKHDQDSDHGDVLGIADVQGSFGKIRTECIVALKVYDQCRQQDCHIILH